MAPRRVPRNPLDPQHGRHCAFRRESRRPDSNRGPLHYEASHEAGSDALKPSLRTTPDPIGPISRVAVPPERPQLGEARDTFEPPAQPSNCAVRPPQRPRSWVMIRSDCPSVLSRCRGCVAALSPFEPARRATSPCTTRERRRQVRPGETRSRALARWRILTRSGSAARAWRAISRSSRAVTTAARTVASARVSSVSPLGASSPRRRARRRGMPAAAPRRSGSAPGARRSRR